MSTISRVSVQPFRLPMKGELRWGKAGRLEALEHVFVRVETGEGQVGIAEAPVRPSIYGETLVSIRHIIAEHFGPRLEGLDIFDEAGVRQVLASVANNPCARGALDIALYDLRAQCQGTTLFETLRGPQAHVRVSYILGMASLETMVEEARQIYARGVSVFKVKVGQGLEQDAQVIRALSDEFSGGDVILYADANEGLTAETAARALERLAALGLAYVEEPLPVTQLKARQKLKAEGILPIIADDSCFTLGALERELEADSFDILNIKPARTGVGESLKMLERARSAGKSVMIGSQASSGWGTRHAAMFASRLGVTHPSELSFPLKLKKDSLETPITYRQGVLEVAQLATLELAGQFRTPV